MNKLPATLVRGNTYYLADGSYGSYTFNTANSGTTRVTVKKAQSYDFGRASDGCSNDISAGWNTATMGGVQAAFTDISNNVSTVGYITIDGNGTSTAQGCGGAPTTNTNATDCGIKFNAGGSGPLDIGANNGGANRSNGWTIRYTEAVGSGDVTQAEQNMIFCHGGCDSLVIDHAWWYNSSCDFIKLPWTTSTTVTNSYFQQNFSNATCHGQFFLSEVTTDGVDMHNNVFSDIQGTGLFVIVTGGQASNYNIYNNILLRPNGSSRPGFSNGIFSCINTGTTCTNIKFIGNSVANYTADYAGALGIHCDANPDTFTWQNNIFYNISPSDRISFDTCGGTFTEDHNSWLNSGSPANGAGDITVTSGAPNPFANWPNADFRLASQNANWGSGTILASPFNVDAVGNLRPGTDGVWNRGAYQSAGTASQPPVPPSNLTTVVR